MAHVRERPPLRYSIQIVSPSNRTYRWGRDERNPANVPITLSSSSTMPGGFEQCDVTLPRKPGIDYSDLERLSTIRVLDAGCGVAWEGRLERSPRTSGDQMAVTPGAVGMQAHLEDNKAVREIYVDRDMTRWTGVSTQRKLALIAGNFGSEDGTLRPDPVTGTPALATEVTAPWASTARGSSFMVYDTTGIEIYNVDWFWQKSSTINAADVNWYWTVAVADDHVLTDYDEAGNLRAAGPSARQILYATTNTRHIVQIGISYAVATAVGDGTVYGIYWNNVAVFGRGATGLGITDTSTGLVSLDAAGIVRNAIDRWAPLITATADTVVTSDFPIPHLAFLEPTTTAEIIRQVTRFGLQDWAVWEGPTFYWNERNARGRKWRARIAPAQLEETGPQVERLWESVLVQYRDVDGSTRTVGPPGSGVDVEDAALKDSDPDNPANKLGIIRRDLLTMGTSTSAGAIEVGRRFLEQTKLLDTSGRAALVGHVEDDRGVLHPFSAVRAGDQISFVDAADTSYRRIVRASHDFNTFTCNVDLDAPPEALQALLERLDVSLVSLGV